MRLIDADALPKLLDAEYKQTMKLIWEGEKHLDTLAEGFAEAIHIVKYIAPTVDAVPVVRCKDCKPVVEFLQPLTAQAAPKPMTNSGGQTMAEYIDRVEYCEKHCRCNNDYCNRQSCPIWEAPAADVAPVVRGRGSGKPMVEPVQPLTAQDAPKPMTNGDRIRAMTDEELAESDELLSGLCNVLHGQGYPCEANTCRECLIKWLGSPEKEANDGQ